MAESVKQISIQGAALVDWKKSKGLIKRNARKTRKQQRDEQEGGFDAPPGPQINVKQVNLKSLTNAANPLPTPSAIKLGGGEESVQPMIKEKENKKEAVPAIKQEAGGAPFVPTPGAPLVTTPGHMPNPPPVTPPQLSKGGGSTGKVELVAPKKKATRHGIVLAPPRESKKKHIRGHTRKIRVQLSNMKRRMQTAKLIHKQSSEKPIEEIRTLLENSKLIRSGKSSVPESLLRNMYRDYLVLRSKAL